VKAVTPERFSNVLEKCFERIAIDIAEPKSQVHCLPLPVNFVSVHWRSPPDAASTATGSNDQPRAARPCQRVFASRRR
jgi:hypothetical protein